MKNLTELAKEIHEWNVHVGWWDDFEVKSERHELAKMLVISELVEAMEGYRKDLFDEHLPEFKMFDVELADAMIRLLDLAGAYELNLNSVYEFVERDFHFESQKNIPEQLYQVVKSIHGLWGKPFQHEITQGIISIMIVAKLNDVDLWKLVDLKRVYNKERLDHKRENRNKDGGKKF